MMTIQEVRECLDAVLCGAELLKTDVDDIIDLLQKQEPVEPKWASGYKGGVDALCGSCMEWLADRLWSYCPRCGRKIKWNNKENKDGT